MPEYRVKLETIVRKARKHNFTTNHMCLLLALAEVGAWDTPYFVGLKDDELANAMIVSIKKNLKKFFTHYMDPNWKEENIYTYLAELKEFKFNPEAVKNVYKCIKQRGEMKYGFKNISRVGTENKESRRAKKDRT